MRSCSMETLASGTMKVYGLLSSQGLEHLNIIPALQALALGQSINLHNALS